MTGTTERGEVLISQPLRVEHDCLDKEVTKPCTLKLAPMHVTNWEEAQGEDMRYWPPATNGWVPKKYIPPQKRDALLKTCMGEHSDSEERKVLFCVRNSFTMKKGMLYVNIMPKGKTERLLAFIIPSAHQRTVLNSMHRDARHQGQQRMIATSPRAFLVAKDG